MDVKIYGLQVNKIDQKELNLDFEHESINLDLNH